MLKTVFGVKCIFAVGGLGFVDSVNRYFVYEAIVCRQVEVVVLQYLAEHLSGSQITSFFIRQQGVCRSWEGLKIPEIHSNKETYVLNTVF